MTRRIGKVIIFDEEDGWEATSYSMMEYNKAYIIHKNKQIISIYDIDKNGKVSFERNISEQLTVTGMIKEFDKISSDDILKFNKEFEKEGKE